MIDRTWTLRSSLGGFAAVAAIAATAAFTPGPVAQEACMATFTPGSVRASEDAVSVLVEMSEPIGEVGMVEAQEGSGIEPGAYDAQRNSLELDTSGATAGEWEITFRGGEDMVCTGTLTVESSSR